MKSMFRVGRSFAVLAAICFAAGHASAGDSCVRYGEELHDIAGILEIRAFFGPPNFGEEPKTDRRDVQGVLFLDQPICAAASDQTHEQAEPEQIEVTLIPDVAPKLNLARFSGDHVLVSGKLLHSFTGHHHTALLLSLSGVPRPVIESGASQTLR